MVGYAATGATTRGTRMIYQVVVKTDSRDLAVADQVYVVTTDSRDADTCSRLCS